MLVIHLSCVLFCLLLSVYGCHMSLGLGFCCFELKSFRLGHGFGECSELHCKYLYFLVN